ncbi:MAG: serine/threonine protein kinase [Lachnospiraceae bacterium]|nr:serine/threonine protein kinase [Lachnospiraceae bacterium]
MKEDSLLLPEGWREWTLGEVIGRGSYGTVYKAQRVLGTRTLYSAIKIIDIPHDEEELNAARREYSDEGIVKAFFDDIEEHFMAGVGTLAALNGTNVIVPIEDLWVEKKSTAGCRIFIRMEYLKNLYNCEQAGEMSDEEILNMAFGICDALSCLEREDFLHRNIKPENIFRSAQGVYKLGDFGTPHMTVQQSGMKSARNTVLYMAPEAYKSQSVGAYSDIYSLGMVLYRLSNKNRFPLESLEDEIVSYRAREDALNRRMNGETFGPPVEATAEFADVIMKACAFFPGNRYQSAAEMRADLLKLQGRTLLLSSEARQKTAPLLSPSETQQEIVTLLKIETVPHRGTEESKATNRSETIDSEPRPLYEQTQPRPIWETDKDMKSFRSTPRDYVGYDGSDTTEELIWSEETLRNKMLMEAQLRQETVSDSERAKKERAERKGKRKSVLPVINLVLGLIVCVMLGAAVGATVGQDKMNAENAQRAMLQPGSLDTETETGAATVAETGTVEAETSEE